MSKPRLLGKTDLSPALQAVCDGIFVLLGRKQRLNLQTRLLTTQAGPKRPKVHALEARHSDTSTPASRSTPAPGLGGPSHRTGLPPAQRPPAAPRAYSPCSLLPRSRTREQAPSDTELLR
ncbi:unnamed protein product [Gulo gulo]|uniref:Uncharacterized protein n=1 Tax=Gulo gulo TaxID=48420 RepID=A0A9X9Q4S5_GULGU|nr:unnamed protein product [Gulo gulo]